MLPNPPLIKNKQKKVNPLFLLALPLLVALDVIVYFMTKSSCWNCFAVDEFTRNSSLSFHILSQTLPFLKAKT